jgi:HEAT repeat protein
MKALESVQRINQTHGTTALIQATRADQVEQRRAAIVAIERLAIYEAQEHLLRLMEEDTDESIRRDAAIALGKLADEVTGQKLLDRVSNPEAATDVRTKAIRALGFTTLHPDLDIVMPLSNIRNDPAQPVRLQVAYSLGQLEEKDGLETLRLLSNDENEDVRKAAEESIKLVEKALPVPPVEKLINDLKKPDVQARVRAAKKLGRVQTLDAVDALIETLGDANPMVQITAANALGKICHRKAEPALQRLSHSPNDTVRGAARNALARLESLKTESPPEALEDLPKPVSGDEQQVAVDTEAMVSATEPATQHDKVSHSAVSSVPSVPSSHAANAAPAPETPIQRVQAPAPSTTQPQMQPRPQTSQTPPEESGMPMWLVGGIVLVIAIVVVVVIVVAGA